MGDLGKTVQHDILIKPTDNNGFIVEIGCRKFSFEGPNNLLRELRRYLNNPEGMERELQSRLHEKESTE